MSAWTVYRSLGPVDARNVVRDPMLRWLVVLMPAFGLLLRFAVPPIAMLLERRFEFDLTAYYPLIMSLLPLMVSGTIGTVVGFLLLDQRDDQTMSALLVTPLSLGEYVRYRLSVMLALGVVFSSVAVPLASLTDITALQVVTASIVAAPLAPIYALFIGSFAGNKVQGFALTKAMGIAIVPCIAAYVVTGPWQWAFGTVPHYWSMKVFWLFDEGAVPTALIHAGVGLAWQALLVLLLARRFSGIVRR